jgi:hypothetical protein
MFPQRNRYDTGRTFLLGESPVAKPRMVPGAVLRPYADDADFVPSGSMAQITVGTGVTISGARNNA